MGYDECYNNNKKNMVCITCLIIFAEVIDDYRRIQVKRTNNPRNLCEMIYKFALL